MLGRRECAPQMDDEMLYQPKKRTFKPRGKAARSFRKTKVVAGGPLVLMF